MVVVGAIALIVSFITATSAHAQKIADTFFELKLIPKPIKVSDAVVLAQP